MCFVSMCFGGKGGAFSRPDRGIIDFRRPFGPGTGGLLPLFVLVPPVGGRCELAGGGASSASTGVPNAMDFRRDDWLRPLGSGIDDSVVRRLRDELLIVDGADSLEGKSTRPVVLSPSGSAMRKSTETTAVVNDHKKDETGPPT
jgi:hypothetical protein